MCYHSSALTACGYAVTYLICHRIDVPQRLHTTALVTSFSLDLNFYMARADALRFTEKA
jgi:hypothetical protein